MPDSIYINLKNSPRKFAFPLQVQNIGYSSGKPVFYKGPFESVDFCFVLSCKEKQTYDEHINGEDYSSPIPCLRLNIPGNYYDISFKYPIEELYVSYSRNQLPVITRLGINFSAFSYSFRADSSFHEIVRKILILCAEVADFGKADMLDCLCYELIINSLISNTTANKANKNEAIVRKIASYIQLNCFHEDISIAQIIKKFNISERTFRRYWKDTFKIPPLHYILKLRIDKARRMLINPEACIYDIADQLNFSDPFYFSRKFKKETGISPRQYQQKLRC